MPIRVMQACNISRIDIGWENSVGINAWLSATLLDLQEWYIVNIKHLQKFGTQAVAERLIDDYLYTMSFVHSGLTMHQPPKQQRQAF